MRACLILLLLVLGGCVFSAAESADLAPGDDDMRGDGQCSSDDGCILAGASCCACPSFALPTSSGWDDACDQVDCPAPPAGACSSLVARCDDGACVAVCAPVSCDLSCEGGFAVDDAGCTLCACGSGPVAPECSASTDCVRVPADCCGCDRGGADTAVPVNVAGGFVDMLGCSGAEACPGVSTCAPGATPVCAGGRCMLGAAGTAPPDDDLCGRPELPPCPAGESCVINADDAEMGQGRCQAP
jgi:hypothetical protein